MFNFTTNVIINSTDNLVVDDSNKSFIIKRYRSFYGNKEDERVKSIYKAEGYDAKLTKVTIDSTVFTALKAAIPTGKTKLLCRISIYVRLQGSNDPLWANDFVFKGKPFQTEFIVNSTDDASTIADRIAFNIKKSQSVLLDDAILNVSTDSGKVILTAVNEYERIYNVAVEKYDDMPEYADGLYTPVYTMGTMKALKSQDGTTVETSYFDNGSMLIKSDGTKVTNAPSDANKIVVEQGLAGFGTYKHLIKDYRLPTQANLRWLKIDEDNYPIKGVKYNQYTIRYESDRGVTGQSVVGQPGSSITTHVFWVAQGDVATEFEKGLKAIGWSNGNAADTNKNGIYDVAPKYETKPED